jgi:peroxiredoxin
MIKSLLALFLLAALTYAIPAQAALTVGADAPDFTTQASLGGNVYDFSLADALKKGPVVLYFFPAAFTQGCTLEAHDFAEATDQFNKLGATVIGVSHDSIATLQKFSISECRNKFAVAADPQGSIMQSYDAVMTSLLNLADRVSYVITPDHKIYYAYDDSDPDQHVANTLKALQDWRSQNPMAVKPTAKTQK